MADLRCVVDGCDHNSLGLCRKAWMCDEGALRSFAAGRLGHLGEWRVRSVSGGDVLCATLRGASGDVQLWCGAHHRTEVWFVERGTRRGQMVLSTYRDYHDGAVVDAIGRACSMAGAQTRMEV